MRKIYTSSNNGVGALVTESVYREIMAGYERTKQAIDRRSPGNLANMVNDYELFLDRYPRPIFTFADGDSLAPFVTGSKLMLSRLRAFLVNERQAAFYDLAMGTGSFYVPFSNGLERDSQQIEKQRRERSFRTTAEQFVDAFDLFAPLPIPGGSR